MNPRNKFWSLLQVTSLLISTLLPQSVLADSNATPTPHRGWSFSSVALTPTLSGGRIKPLDSFAREAVLFETGSRTYAGWNAVDLLFSWIAFPTYWESREMIRVSREDVRRQLGLDETRTTFSPQELIKNSSLAQYAEGLGRGVSKAPSPMGEKKDGPREQELKSVVEKVAFFNSLVTGQGWMVIPKSGSQAWGSLLDHDGGGMAIQKTFIQLLKAYQAGDQAGFETIGGLFKASVENEIPGFQEQLRNPVRAEQIYNETRPFLYAWIFYLIAAIAWGILAGAQKKVTVLRWTAGGASLVAIASHIFGFGLRCFIAGRPPVTNMYESVIWVCLGVVVFSWILYGIHRQAILPTVASALACLGLIAGDVAPTVLDPSINPLVPVLRSNYWLTIHVLTITLGYAAFALTFGLANVSLFQLARRAVKQKVLALNQLTYRAMQFGVVLIAAGTILGGIWADYSWGRFWGWDPKEVWALITLLCYIVILHGRYTNWIGQFGFALWSALSFMSVVMAWYGVNFILGVGLHSYGFSTGGTPWVLGFVALELIYVLGITAVYRRQSG